MVTKKIRRLQARQEQEALDRQVFIEQTTGAHTPGLERYKILKGQSS
jgi:hypothetical protein